MNDPEFLRLMVSRSQSTAADQAAAYANRGRAFKDLADADLASRWLESLRRCAETWCTENGNLYNDLTSEFALRNITPPLEQAVPIYGQLRAAFQSRVEEMQRNPAAWKDANDRMLADLVKHLTDIEEAN